MAFQPITGAPSQYSTLNNELASGYWLKMYDAGTTDEYSMATDSSGTTRLAKCALSSEGYPVTNEGDDTTVFVPHVNQNYRLVLYKNETDADNNTTANAAWNVDNLLPDATNTASASEITLRDVTVQTQDDYDRSPLFTDGDGFTAGVGPHVITVPTQVPAWTPNDGSMRFYRLQSSGFTTELTPTSSDATTFTLAETLLSTDTIFIGDDNFRNQMAGDPENYRTVLGLDPEVVPNYFSTETYYRIDHTQIASTGAYTVSSQPDNTFESVGPTGSGADNIWTELDGIPLTAKSITFLAYLDAANFSSGSGGKLTLEGRVNGAINTNDTGNYELARLEANESTFSGDFSLLVEATVAIDENNIFECKWNDTNLSSRSVRMYIRGFNV